MCNVGNDGYVIDCAGVIGPTAKSRLHEAGESEGVGAARAATRAGWGAAANGRGGGGGAGLRAVVLCWVGHGIWDAGVCLQHHHCNYCTLCIYYPSIYHCLSITISFFLLLLSLFLPFSLSLSLFLSLPPSPGCAMQDAPRADRLSPCASLLVPPSHSSLSVPTASAVRRTPSPYKPPTAAHSHHSRCSVLFSCPLKQHPH